VKCDGSTYTLVEAAAALEAGRLTAREVCERVLEAAERLQPELNAFTFLDRERCLAEAEEADARRRAGRARSRFDGLPVAIKDNISVIGQPCTCASRILAGYTSPYDATAAARLREAGFVFPCRTNMDEFAMGSTSETGAFGPVANPWSKDHVTGGSSGGSAAAVAAGIVPAALGSDTGGSIRQPAAFCGVVGLKPTYGRVSRYGLVAYASSLDQIGPVTRSVRDAAVLLDVIGGPDSRDSTTLPEKCGGHEAALESGIDVDGLRIGLAAEYMGSEALNPEVRSAVEAAARELERAGARCVDVHFPHLDYAVAAYYIIATAEASANLARFDGVRYGLRVEGKDLIDTYCRTRAEGFGDEVKRRIILGAYVLSSGYYDAYYLRAQKVRTLIRRDFLNAFEECDVLLCPVAPTPAPRRNGFSSPLEMYLADIYTISANLAGVCGLSVPWTLSSEGLPIGVQLMGPHLGEETLLRAGAFLEQVSGFEERPPLYAGA